MLVLTVVGARPQFVKAAVVSRTLRRLHREVLLHTGQHYDDAMSDLFFRELGLPVPDRRTASHVIGLGLQDSLRHALPTLPREQYAEFLALYRGYFLEREDTLSLFPGVPELLSELKERGYQLAVATGKPRRGSIARCRQAASARCSPPRAAATKRTRSRTRRCCWN